MTWVSCLRLRIFCVSVSCLCNIGGISNLDIFIAYQLLFLAHIYFTWFLSRRRILFLVGRDPIPVQGPHFWNNTTILKRLCFQGVWFFGLPKKGYGSDVVKIGFKKGFECGTCMPWDRNFKENEYLFYLEFEEESVWFFSLYVHQGFPPVDWCFSVIR